MYLAMLAPLDREFETAVQRAFPHYKSARLDAVVAALRDCQQQPLTAQRLRTLIDALETWRTRDPNEYAARGIRNGVGYRLYMEAKQRLGNAFAQFPYPVDPPMPGGCPGDVVLGTYVPPSPGPALGEVCHGFTYRWLVARGKLADVPPRAQNQEFNGPMMLPVLFLLGAAGYPAARAASAMHVQAGDLVGMFDNAGNLVHSVIVVTPDTWFGANNTGCFAVPLGRSLVDLTAVPAGAWVGTGNTWQTGAGAQLTAVYHRFP